MGIYTIKSTEIVTGRKELDLIENMTRYVKRTFKVNQNQIGSGCTVRGFGRFLTPVKGELAVGPLPFSASDLLPQDALLKEIWSPFPLPGASQVAQW